MSVHAGAVRQLRSSPRPLAVVIVTYNSSAVIEDCIRSIDPSCTGSARLIVVDNASSDDTPAVVRAVRPNSEIIALPTNGGFATGVNAGFAAAPDHDVLVLNPDIRLAPGAVDELRRGLARPGVGIVVPTLTTTDGALQPSLRRRPTILRAIGEATLGGSVAGRLAILGGTVVDPRRYREESSTDWATGAAWLVSRECRDVIGSLDERYFLYSEETEYMLRAGQRGLSVRFLPRAVAVHLGGEQTTSAMLWSLSVTNRVRLHREQRGSMAFAGMWCAVMVNELIRAVLRPQQRGLHLDAVRALVTMRRWPRVPAS